MLEGQSGRQRKQGGREVGGRGKEVGGGFYYDPFGSEHSEENVIQKEVHLCGLVPWPQSQSSL
jgi:hypothetical protein